MSFVNRRQIVVGAGALAAVGAIGGVWWSQERPEKQDESNVISLRLAWIPQATFSGDYAAEQKALWRDQDLRVTINPGGFQYDSIRLVAAKSDFVGIASGPEVLEAQANGVPVIAVGVVIPDSPIVWVSKTESGIRSPQDFLGRKVGSQVGTLTEITLEALFARLNLSIDRVERVPMQFDYQPFLSGALDVVPCYVIDQVVNFRRQGFSINIIDPREYGINLGPANLYFVHEDTLRNQPDVVQRFLNGAASGWKYAYAHRREVASYLSRFTDGVGREDLKAQMDAVFDFINPSTDYPGVYPISLDRMRGTSMILKEYGRLPRSFDERTAWSNDLMPLTD